MTSMFWGLRLEPGKRYSTTVDKSFHVSMAALDCSSVKSDNEVLSVMIDEGESKVPFILCNLQKNKLLQSPLDLNFMTGDRITFFCKGHGVVHLSGYIVPEDDEFGQLEEEDDEDEEGEDEVEEASDEEVTKPNKGKGKVNGVQGKRKVEDVKSPQSPKLKVQKLDEDTDDSDDEDDDEDDDVEDESISLEGESDDEDDDEDEEDSQEEEESEEENMPSKSMVKMKKNISVNKQQPSGPNKQQGSPNLNKHQNTPSSNKQNQGKQQKTPNGMSPNTQMKKDKKKGEKTPGGVSPLNTKLNKFTDEGGSPATKKSADGGTPKKVLEGGVVVKDIKMGNGQLCKNGKSASVYYTGRLKQNNKVFDSITGGSAFKFTVGSGEVIKGWDVGVVGMKVGGKRLITCPPPMAYGQKGTPPTIPPNSTLVFEVELKSVN